MANILGPLGGLGIIGFIIWLLENYEKYEKFKACVIKPFIKGRKTLQKRFLSNKIQGKINTFSKSVAEEIGEKEKYRVKIEWVDRSDTESFFKNDELIIRMDCKDNINRNLALATLIYVSETLVKKARPYIDKILNKAMDLMATKRIFEEETAEDEKEYYNHVMLFPQLENDKELRDDCENIQLLEQKGYFTRLFLRELRFLGELLDTTIPTDEVKKEVRQFLGYLINLAKTPLVQEPGRWLAPEEFKFERRYLKVQFVLFARVENVTLKNIRPYLKRIKNGLKEGIDIFYLLARQDSIELLRLLEKDISRRLVRKRILKRSDDRTFVVKKSGRKKEKHNCIIYRRLQKFKDINIDDIFEDLAEDEGEIKDNETLKM